AAPRSPYRHLELCGIALEIECKAVSGARFAPGAAFLCSNSICLQRPPCISTFLPGAMRASHPTGYFVVYHTFSSNSEPNIS
ncbi:hypothetical protein, partial [Gemmiger sp.]|uniref:hypothetical protein n=1 Tax=Gemmiger sp. TaxID=2049027 RepID=UPI0025C14E81